VRKHCSFHHKTMWIATVFPTWFFCLFLVFFLLFFLKKFLCRFFFNIELIKNLALLFFSLKHCELLQCFSMWFFSKLSLSIVFWILSWLKIIITIKLNHMRKALYLFSQNIVDCYNFFLNGFLVYFIGKSSIVFLTKHFQLLQRFFHGFFSSKIIFVGFF